MRQTRVIASAAETPSKFRSEGRILTLLCRTMGSSGCCRFGWYPKILAFFVTAGLGLSATSSLYCDFMTIVLDFTPGGYYQNQVGLGLWSFESPLGQCVSYVEAYESGGLGMGYSDWFMNKDFSWTVARILAMTGGLFGTISLVSVVMFKSIFFTSQQYSHLARPLSYSQLCSMAFYPQRLLF